LEFFKYAQSYLQMPVIKLPRLPTPPQKQNSSQTTIAADPLGNLESEEVIKVESSEVNLNVRVYGNDSSAYDSPLQKEDFVVLKMGKNKQFHSF
ncbi:hypothetical protein, partial [Acinetobacter baumannii]|uniref:hypothetical protein n=1 Tax=Acinetobacter baumannii TaxID=470 RepID=UPI00241CDE7A